MGVLTTGNTFSTGDQVTASKLNAAVNSATLQAAAVDNTSTQLSSGAIIVKDLGITQDKIASDAVGTNQLANDVVVNTSGSITGAAGSFTTLAASGVVSVPDGSESVPSITNTGDTNTGIYFPAENSVALTAGAGATLTSTNAAITIDVPTSIVSTAQSDLTLQGGDANSKNLIFKKASAQQGKITAVGDELKFYAGTSGTETLELTTTQAVVTGNLHVVGDDEETSAINTATATSLEVAGNGTSTNSGGAVIFSANSGAWKFAAIKSLVQSGTNNTVGDLAFSTRLVNNDSTLTEAMRIKYNGNLGIGTTAPMGVFHAHNGGTQPTAFSGLAGVFSKTTGGATQVSLYSANDTVCDLLFSDPEDVDVGRVRYDHSSNSMSLTTNAATQMTIDSSGNVGIGTQSPEAPLTVTSTTGGVLLPRMSTSDRTSISSPTNGEMVYDTSLNKFYGYANGSWVAFH